MSNDLVNLHPTVLACSMFFWGPQCKNTERGMVAETDAANERIEAAELAIHERQRGSLSVLRARGGTPTNTAASLLALNGTAAAAEFQKLIDHRGIVLNFPLGALAHLQLGRAYLMSGDATKAKSAYQDFFALWKDADPDIPILKEAKAEYAKLQ